MDITIAYKKFDELQNQINNLKKENSCLKKDIASIKKNMYKNQSIHANSSFIDEQVFISHAKNIEYLNEYTKPNLDLNTYVSNKSISRDELLSCFKDFGEGIKNIIRNLSKDKLFPIANLEFNKKNYLYCFDGNNWKKSSDDDLITFVNNVIKGIIFQEFCKWQNDNLSLLRNNEHEASNYHVYLQLILTPSQSFVNKIKSDLGSTIKQIN